jgi:hypothetical protein
MKNSPYRDKPLVSLAAALRVHAGGNRGKNHNGSPRRKSAASAEGHAATRVADSEIADPVMT